MIYAYTFVPEILSWVLKCFSKVSALEFNICVTSFDCYNLIIQIQITVKNWINFCNWPKRSGKLKQIIMQYENFIKTWTSIAKMKAKSEGYHLWNLFITDTLFVLHLYILYVHIILYMSITLCIISYSYI